MTDWTDIVPDRGSRPLPQRVTMGWRSAGGSRSASMRASFTISKHLATALGWSGKMRVLMRVSGPGAHVMLARATGEDDSPARAWAVSWRSGSMSVLAPLTWVQGQARRADDVAHRIENGALVLTLPAWARREPPKPERPAPRVEPMAVPARSSAGAKPSLGTGNADDPDRAPLDDRDRRELEAELRRNPDVRRVAQEFGQPVAVVNAVKFAMGAGA